MYWQSQDRRTLKKLNALIKDIQRGPFTGAGKPEPLKGELAGFWSRRMDEKNRVVYRQEGDVVSIVSCHTSRAFAFRVLHEPGPARV